MPISTAVSLHYQNSKTILITSIMKNISIFCLAQFLLLVLCFQISCTKEPIVLNNPTNSNSSNAWNNQFPDAINNYVAANYPSLPIKAVELKDGTTKMWVAELSNGTILYFNEDGSFAYIGQDTNISAAELPTVATNYITTNYPTATIQEANHKANGNYEVKLNNDLELNFSPQGNFLFADMSGNDDGTEINFSQLPGNAQNYINTNFANETIDKIRILDDNGNYFVKFDSDTKLWFSPTGQHLFTDVDEVLLPEEIPDFVLNYIATNYQGATIIEAELKDNGIIKIELSNNIKLFFTPSGEILYDGEDASGLGINTIINTSNLPDKIANYIESNYPSLTVVEAKTKSNGDYEIRLEGGIRLRFDAQGNFLYEITEFELEFTDIAFPDTVKIGETVVLSGKVRNAGITPVQNNQIALNIGIEDVMPTELKNVETDGTIIAMPQTEVLLPAESKNFALSIQVTAARFNPSTKDIAVVWPDIPTCLKPIITSPNSGIITLETFVKP